MIKPSIRGSRRSMGSDSGGDPYHSLYQTTFMEYAAKSGINQGLSHVGDDGEARMVDVSDKAETARTAKATAVVRVGAEAYKLIQQNQMKKGDVLTVAQIAGIMGSKKTPELIPLCHPISLTKVDLRVRLDPGTTDCVTTECEAKCLGQTGVEMEAMTGAAVAALTVYDMVKAVNKFVAIENLQLVSKTGGSSGSLLNPAFNDDQKGP